jgi:type IV pilus assembly protein PilW
MRTPTFKARRRTRGMSLVELMVAVGISSSLIAGALFSYAEYRRVYSVSEVLARVQEQARFAMGTIEPDIELAGFYGFTNNPDSIRWVRGSAPGTVLATAPRLRQRPLPPLAGAPVPAPDLDASAQACGTNFAVDVSIPVQGSNNEFLLGPGADANCDPYGSGAVAGSDTLTLRRAATIASAPEAGRLQIYASRFSSRTAQLLFADGVVPGPINDDNRVHDFVVRAYYIARDSVDRRGVPALRVKALSRNGGVPAFIDNEVMPGVEDLQVQFGIDSGDYDNDGAVDASVDANGDGVPESDGRATRYVNPDFPGLDRLQVVSVRIWLRVRGDQLEPGFVDDRTYRYADVEYTPAGDERAFRRVLLTRTIALRNARIL